MSFIKGNYDLGNKKPLSEPEESESTPTKTFEDFARERLGGSIAFVMKNKTFVWKGDDQPKDGIAASPSAKVAQMRKSLPDPKRET